MTEREKLIEEMARAICASLGFDPDEEDGSFGWKIALWEKYQDTARRALDIAMGKGG